MNKFAYIILIVAVAALSWFLYSKWGIIGPVVLIGLFGLSHLYVLHRIKSAQSKIITMLKNMTPEQIDRKLEQLDAKARQEQRPAHRQEMLRQIAQIRQWRAENE